VVDFKGRRPKGAPTVDKQTENLEKGRLVK